MGDGSELKEDRKCDVSVSGYKHKHMTTCTQGPKVRTLKINKSIGNDL